MDHIYLCDPILSVNADCDVAQTQHTDKINSKAAVLTRNWNCLFLVRASWLDCNFSHREKGTSESPYLLPKQTGCFSYSKTNLTILKSDIGLTTIEHQTLTLISALSPVDVGHRKHDVFWRLIYEDFFCLFLCFFINTMFLYIWQIFILKF